jgi:hypothetical protein
MDTTLNQIRQHDPCTDGWAKLLAHLGKTKADNEPLSLLTILESNGIEDAIWALRYVEGHDQKIRHFAADCAEYTLHIYESAYPGDTRPRQAIQAARDFADGTITAAARAAACDAAWAAARDAAGAAAWAAAGAAARAAARAAAGDAACDAAGAAAEAAAWAAAREKQKTLFINRCRVTGRMAEKEPTR